jgi:hypothetical protein
MFARFRQTPNRLQVSLVEASRFDGKVRQQHVAALGSILAPPSINDRMTFWAALHQRLARLSNRISTDDQHKVMAAIHARVPVVISDEQRRLQRDNAEHDLTVFSGMHDMTAATLADHKAFAANLARKIADLEATAAESAASADAARERLAKIHRGEEVSGGLGKPISFEDILRSAGYTAADFRHLRVVAELGEIGAFEEYIAESKEAGRQWQQRERAIARAFLKRHRAKL